MLRLPQAPGLVPSVRPQDRRGPAHRLEDVLDAVASEAEQGAPLKLRERTLESLNRYGAVSSLVPTTLHRKLSPQNLWDVYHENSEVRACVEMVVRKVSTWPWRVRASVSFRDESYGDAKKQARKITRALRAPNADGEFFQTLIAKIVKDLLIYDQCAMEKVFESAPVQPSRGVPASKVSVMTEILAARGVEIYPVMDTKGYVKGWVRETLLSDAWMHGYVAYQPGIHDAPGAMLSKRQIVRMSLFPDTNRPGGTPLLETLVHEVGVVLQSSEHLYRSFSSYDVPPGLLFLTGVSLDDKQSRTSLESLRDYNTQDTRLKLLSTPEVGGTGQWLEFGHTPKEVGYAEVLREVKRTIYRVFGLPSALMGDTEALQREQPTDVNSSHITVAVLDLVETALNERIVPEMLLRYGYGAHDPKVEFVYDREARLSAAERRDKASGLSTSVIHGIMTINEARSEMSYDPVDYGDIPRANGVPMVIIDSSGSYVVPTPGGGTTPVANNTTPTAPQGAAVDQEVAQNQDATEDSPGRPPERSLRGIVTRADVSTWESLPEDELRVDLAALGLAILAFDDALTGSWEATAERIRREVLRAESGGRSAAAARAIEGMLAEWEAISPRFYQRAARIGRESARDIGGGDFDASGFGAEYAERVTTYYDDLAVDLQAKTRAAIADAESSTNDARQVADAAALAFASRSARVENWSGKLLEVASVVMVGALLAADDDGWEVRWVRTKGGHGCSTCTSQSGDWFDAREIRLYPGADTQCGAKCRCYYAYRKKS